MANPNITCIVFTRLRAAHGTLRHTLLALTSMISGMHVEVYTANIDGLAQRLIAPVTGMAQSRTVSISRGSPPPELRR